MAMQARCHDKAVVMQVQGALKAMHRIQFCTDLFLIHEGHQDFDQGVHQEIFVTDQVESMLLTHSRRLLVCVAYEAVLCIQHIVTICSCIRLL